MEARAGEKPESKPLISGVRIDNFRSLPNAEVELGRVTVVVGGERVGEDEPAGGDRDRGGGGRDGEAPAQDAQMLVEARPGPWDFGAVVVVRRRHQ
jgi:hypothetical protein